MGAEGVADVALYDAPVRGRRTGSARPRLRGNTVPTEEDGARLRIGAGIFARTVADDDNVDVIGLFVGLHPTSSEDDDDPSRD